MFALAGSVILQSPHAGEFFLTARHGLAHYLSSAVWLDAGSYLVCWAAVSWCVVGPLLASNLLVRCRMTVVVRSGGLVPESQCYKFADFLFGGTSFCWRRGPFQRQVHLQGVIGSCAWVLSCVGLEIRMVATVREVSLEVCEVPHHPRFEPIWESSKVSLQVEPELDAHNDSLD